MVITTINAYCGLRFLIYALRGRGGSAEPVHPDHVAYYSYATIHRLLDKAGMDVRRFLFYDIGPEHRPHQRRTRTGSMISWCGSPRNSPTASSWNAH